MSALELLGKLISRFHEGEIEKVMIELIDVVKTALDSSRAPLRKAAVECLVDVYLVFGDQLWDYLNDFDNSQRKLVAVFILRVMKSKGM